MSNLIMQLYVFIIKYKLLIISLFTLYFLLLFFGDIFLKTAKINRTWQHILGIFSLITLLILLLGNLIVFNSAKSDERYSAINEVQKLGTFNEVKITNEGWVKTSDDLKITKDGVSAISPHGILVLKAGEIINKEDLSIKTYWGPLTLFGKTYMEVKLTNNEYLKLTMYNKEITYSIDKESFDLKG